MIIVRPVTINDLDSMIRLASQAGFGLTSLPPEPEVLRKRILYSEHSFRCTMEEPGGEIYTLVMEDLDSGEVIGTSSIVSKVGGFEPFYAYQIKISMHESAELNLRREIPMLQLVTEHSGPSEISGLFMASRRRGQGNGRFMSLCRFLFMAEHFRLFEPVVVAEMRGVVDDSGSSPFWEAVGKRFFGLEFPKADSLSIKNKKFIADLLPRNPIYIPLLPEDAQAVIGHVHQNTEPAMELLLAEGFSSSSMVDIFDAGPILTCPVREIRTVKESRRAFVESVVPGEILSEPFMIGNALRDFRACVNAIEILPNEKVRITEAAASALKLKPGERVRFVPLRPSKRSPQFRNDVKSSGSQF